jgi:nitroreductase
MEFFDTVKNRHSIRSFDERAIEKEKIAKIIDTIMLAPSAGNLQAYKIHVVFTQETKEQLQTACMDQEFISHVPVVMVFSADKAASSTRYGERGEELYSVQDATIAAAYAQLAATDLGLANVWVGAFDPLEVSRIINLPADMVPVAVIPVGYAAEKPERRTRKKLSEIVKEL